MRCDVPVVIPVIIPVISEMPSFFVGLCDALFFEEGGRGGGGGAVSFVLLLTRDVRLLDLGSPHGAKRGGPREAAAASASSHAVTVRVSLFSSFPLFFSLPLPSSPFLTFEILLGR